MEGQYVLAVECDWRIRKLIRANLEAVGLMVREAVSSSHGLQLLHEGQPDLILLDMDLYDRDTLQLLSVSQDWAGLGVPIVAMCSDPPERGLLNDTQVVSCLHKPFAAPTLLQHVEQALGIAPTGA